MGSTSSRPERPKVRVLLPTKRASSALRQRISLNRATLNRFLQQIGHPGAGASQARLPVHSASGPSLLSPPPRMSAGRRVIPPHGDAVKQGRETICRNGQVDRNKPLPPLSPQPLRERLVQYAIERHRQETLRVLESQGEQQPRMRLKPGSPVPDIIFRRIEKSAMLWGEPGARAESIGSSRPPHSPSWRGVRVICGGRPI
jgi:hypothetical protein